MAKRKIQVDLDALETDVVTPASTIEYCLVKHLTNDYHSPVSDYIEQHFTGRIEADSAVSADKKKTRITDKARRFLFSRSHEVILSFCFGSYNTSLTFPDNDNWNTRDINFTPRMGATVEVAGDISVSSHAFAMYRFMPRSQKDIYNIKYDADNTVFLSDRPYIAHIAVVIRPECYNRENNGKYRRDEHECHTTIYRNLCERVQRYVGNDALYEVYYSLHTADFIIVLRTAEPSVVYKLSMSLSADSDYYITHTIQSLEMGLVENETPVKISGVPALLFRRPKVTDEGNMRFLAKFSASVEFQNELVGNCRSGSDGLDLASGDGALLGFYDMQVNLSAAQFACLYPALCENRLFKDDGGHDWCANTEQYKSLGDECKCTQDCKHCPANAIGAEILESRNNDAYCRISSLSIDLLYNNTSETTAVRKADVVNIGVNDNKSAINEQSDRVLYIRDETIKLVRRITSLRDKQLLIPYMRTLYISSINLLLDLVRIYIPMAEQADLFLTGRVVYEFVDNLITGIEKAVEQILIFTAAALVPHYIADDSEQNNENNNHLIDLSPTDSRDRAYKITSIVIRLIRRGVDAVNSFSRLTMGVNLQFINAANYELLTRTSAHKILCAYYEFAHELAEDYSNDGNDGTEDNGIVSRKICVLPIPHFNSLQPEAQRLYPHGFVDLEPSLVAPVHPAVVRLPNIDTFLRVYEVVPYLRHEYNHFLHLRDSKEKNNSFRNNYLLRVTMDEIARLIIMRLIEYTGAEYAVLLNCTEGIQHLIDCVTDILKSDFLNDERQMLLDNMLIEELRVVLKHYLKNLLMYSDPDAIEKLSRKDGVDMMFSLIDKYVKINDSNITKNYLERLKRNAYSAKFEATDLDSDIKTAKDRNTNDEKMQEIHDAFNHNDKDKDKDQLYDIMLKQFDGSIKDLTTRLDEIAVKIKDGSATDREAAEQLALLNLCKHEEKRKKIFIIEWEYAKGLFFDALQQPPYSSAEDSIVNSGDNEVMEKTIIREIIKTLDENISAIGSSHNGYLRLIQEYEKIRVWLKHRGNQFPYFWKLHEALTVETVDNCIETYSEARSDIFMCKTLAFNSAGYVYFLVRSMARNMNDPIDAVFYRRVLLTMYALSKKTEYTMSALYREFSHEYELLVQARIAYLTTKLDILCDEILAAAPETLFSNQYVDVIDFSGTKENITITAVQIIKSSLYEALNREQKRRSERFEKMYNDELDIRVRDFMDAETNELRSSIENLFIAFPVLSKLSERLSVCRQALSNNDNPDIGQSEQHKECERFVNRYDSMIALCADQFSDLLEVERLLYKVRRLPECQAYTIAHVKKIADVYAERYAGLKHKNASINSVVTRIGEFYNGTRGEDVATEYTTRKMTDDGVKFINEFYWKNRARMADWRKSEAEDDK